MIKIIDRYFSYKDERGSLEGIINYGQWRELNIIESCAGTIRGNHYHKDIHELFIILDGEIKVVAQRVVNHKLFGRQSEKIVKTGDAFIVEPMINHTFYVIKNSRWINVLSNPFDKHNPDLHRIKSIGNINAK